MRGYNFGYVADVNLSGEWIWLIFKVFQGLLSAQFPFAESGRSSVNVLCWAVFHVPLRHYASICFLPQLPWAFPSRVTRLRLLWAPGIVSTTGILSNMEQMNWLYSTFRQNEIRTPVLVFCRLGLGFHTEAQKQWTVALRGFSRALFLRQGAKKKHVVCCAG